MYYLIFKFDYYFNDIQYLNNLIRYHKIMKYVKFVYKNFKK